MKPKDITVKEVPVKSASPRVGPGFEVVGKTKAPAGTGKLFGVRQALKTMDFGEEIVVSLSYLYPEKHAIYTRGLVSGALKAFAAKEGFRIVTRSEGDRIRIWKMDMVKETPAQVE